MEYSYLNRYVIILVHLVIFLLQDRDNIQINKMVIDMKVHGIKIYNMVKVNSTIQMVTNFMVNLYMEIN